MDVSRQGSAESTAILNLSHPGRQWYREAQWALGSSQSEGRDSDTELQSDTGHGDEHMICFCLLVGEADWNLLCGI